MAMAAGKIQKKFGILTIIFAIPYLLIAAYYIGTLIIAYVVRKESCPIGFLILPFFVWPAFFILYLKFYIGYQFIKNRFNLDRFAKYLIFLLFIEIAFWLFEYSKRVTSNVWFFVFLILDGIYYVYILSYTFKKRKELLLHSKTKSFYLGIDIIKFTDIFLGIAFTVFTLPFLFTLTAYWTKELPLWANIFNILKTLLICCLIYLYFWCAISLKKFQFKSRTVQLVASSLSIIEIFTGSTFFTLLPIHIFSIVYLNLKSIKNLFLK